MILFLFSILLTYQKSNKGMAKVKNKVSIKPVSVVPTTKDKERQARNIEAYKLIDRIQNTGLLQNYIADKMEINIVTLSRFLNKKDGYLTSSMITKSKDFLKRYDEGTLNVAIKPAATK